jgi:hypothetical protein
MLTPQNNVTPRKKQDGGERGTRCLSPWCQVGVERGVECRVERVLPPCGERGLMRQDEQVRSATLMQ